MIAGLEGVLTEKTSSHAYIQCGGVVYVAAMSAQGLSGLPSLQERVFVRTKMLVREDAIELVGFVDQREAAVFEMLTSVSGIGSKMALGILSGMPIGQLAQAIAQGDVAKLTRIHGVGKKTAERAILELRDKVKSLGAVDDSGGASPAIDTGDDVVKALLNLGYREQAAIQVVETVRGENTSMGPEAVLRAALKLLRK